MHWLIFPLFLALLVWASLISREIWLTWRLRKIGVTTLGQVVRHRERFFRSRNNSPRFVPIVRFTTLSGQVVEAESWGASTELDFLNGVEVVVYYDAQQPQRFLVTQELVSYTKYWLLAFALMMLYITLTIALEPNRS
jgi:hypothetical protein